MTSSLSAVQRMVLTYLKDRGKAGSIIASGHKKTRVGYFPALKEDGIATNSVTIYFLQHGGFIEPCGELRFRLSALGAAALKGQR